MAKATTGPSLFFALCFAALTLHAAEARRLPPLYVFGDSTADVGTNNYLPDCAVKANHRYYGIDFPNRTATGRFSNSFNSADELAKVMSFSNSPPPFLSLSQKALRSQMFTGINFASGGSGIFDRTGKAEAVVPMGAQIRDHFEAVRRNLMQALGSDQKVDLFLSKSLFVISAGSNDLFEYSYSNYSHNRTHDPEIVAALTSRYEDHLRDLYGLGARKFGIISVSMLGCCPSQRARTDNGTCYEQLNDLAKMFYTTIGGVLQNLTKKLPGIKYSLANGYEMVAGIIEGRYPSPFKVLKHACCGRGKFKGEIECNSTATYCSNRDDFLFWDWYHPTQKASRVAAGLIYDGISPFVTPINFRQLAEDDR